MTRSATSAFVLPKTQYHMSQEWWLCVHKRPHFLGCIWGCAGKSSSEQGPVHSPSLKGWEGCPWYQVHHSVPRPGHSVLHQALQTRSLQSRQLPRKTDLQELSIKHDYRLPAPVIVASQLLLGQLVIYSSSFRRIFRACVSCSVLSHSAYELLPTSSLEGPRESHSREPGRLIELAVDNLLIRCCNW